MQQDDNQKVTVEDQELANMIAGLNAQAAAATPPPPPPAPVPPLPSQPTAPKPDEFPIPNALKPSTPPVSPAPTPLPKTDNDLAGVKMDALNELRPLVSKLDLPAEEKFDTLLLLIRSTDDKSLVPQAHAAAKQIEDDTRRANALLDIVKEIDFFEHPSS